MSVNDKFHCSAIFIILYFQMSQVARRRRGRGSGAGRSGSGRGRRQRRVEEEPSDNSDVENTDPSERQNDEGNVIICFYFKKRVI